MSSSSADIFGRFSSHLLENKYADFVSIGTSALANPDLPNRIFYSEKLNDFNPN